MPTNDTWTPRSERVSRLGAAAMVGFGLIACVGFLFAFGYFGLSGRITSLPLSRRGPATPVHPVVGAIVPLLMGVWFGLGALIQLHDARPLCNDLRSASGTIRPSLIPST